MIGHIMIKCQNNDDDSIHIQHIHFNALPQHVVFHLNDNLIKIIANVDQERMRYGIEFLLPCSRTKGPFRGTHELRKKTFGCAPMI